MCDSRQTLLDLHNTLQESARKKEDNVLTFFVTFVGIAGGSIQFFYKLSEKGYKSDFDFIYFSVYLILMLACLLACAYTYAVGYTYRTFMYQIGKLQNISEIRINKYIIKSWQDIYPGERNKITDLPESFKWFYRGYYILGSVLSILYIVFLVEYQHTQSYIYITAVFLLMFWGLLLWLSTRYQKMYSVIIEKELNDTQK